MVGCNLIFVFQHVSCLPANTVFFVSSDWPCDTYSFTFTQACSINHKNFKVQELLKCLGRFCFFTAFHEL